MAEECDAAALSREGVGEPVLKMSVLPVRPFPHSRGRLRHIPYPRKPFTLDRILAQRRRRRDFEIPDLGLR